MEVIDIGNRREPFWDNFLLDTDKTTATPRVNHPTYCRNVFEFDKPWEMTGLSYPQVLKVGDKYRLYYITIGAKGEYPEGNYCKICALESDDGINWERPELNNTEYAGDKENNIAIYKVDDNCFIFYDENPDCPPDEKFKGVGSECEMNENGTPIRAILRSWTSPDGYNFKLGDILNENGAFDTLQTVHWVNGEYVIYYRDYIGDDRIIRVMRSKDFKNWTGFNEIKFDDDKFYQLYTNNVKQYERAPHIFVGFPTRYIEKTEWTENLKQLPSYKRKKTRAEVNNMPRLGLALTDCLFMMSRDGDNWHRYSEAFMVPEYEKDDNWIYGDCYPSWDLIDTGDENYYFYTKGKKPVFEEVPIPLELWKIRKDGFAFYEADADGKEIVTKPITFEGEYLHLNFETSAAGSIYVDLLDEDGNEIPGKTSFELYGNTIDRKVFFEDGTNFGEYANKPVRLRFRMSDAKIYSMKFE